MVLHVRAAHKNILFVCKKCSTMFENLKEMNNHQEECSEDLDKDPLATSLLRVDFLESHVRNLEEELRIERIKVIWNQELLKNNSNITLGNVLEVQKDGVHLSCIGSIDPITLFLHYNEYVGPTKVVTATSMKKSVVPVKKKAPTKCCLAPAEEVDDTEKINAVDMKIAEDLRNYKSVSEISEDVAECIENLKTSKQYNKHMASLRRLRSTLIGKYSLNEYKDILQEQIEKVEGILLEKSYDKKKVNTIVLKNITGLEARLLFYPGYTSTSLEMDDLDSLTVFSTLSFPHPKEYVSFDITELQHRICNYTSVVFSMKAIFEKALLNVYGKNNIVYFPLPKSSIEDPYSFYILSKVGKNRSWKLDTRLEDLSTEIRDMVLPYMINMFRTIYFHVFKDNDYRKEFKSCSVAEQDCEQLLNNIVLLTKPMYFCNWLRDLVVKKSEYHPTEVDRTDFARDDLEQRKRFGKPSKDDSEVEILKQLFNNLTAEDAVDIYRERIK